MVTAAAISAGVSPLMRRATRKPPIWAGVHRPSMMPAMAPCISAKVRCCPWMSFPSSGPTMSLPFHLQEIPQYPLAMLGEDGLGMELHPEYGLVAVAQAHDHALIGRALAGGGHRELPGKALPLHDERVVARGGEARQS